jgi:predicted ATPase/class 3 adenylate cyclase
MLTAALSAYLPVDRCHAIAQGEVLPDRSYGAALFADVSGFTALSDALASELGVQNGADEISRQLNRVFEALVVEINRYHGSIISYNGDALTCWFDGDDGMQASTCALAIQLSMQPFAAVTTPAGTTVRLAVKVAVVAGSARRFQIGDPEIQLIDVLAGRTLERLAAVEHSAGPGEVVVSAEVVAALGDALVIGEWRAAEEPAGRVAVIADLRRRAEPTPWAPLPLDRLQEEQLRPWLVGPVYSRIKAGQGQFLSELRPVAVLFASFSGIDYDGDESAHERLDRYIRWVQRSVTRYGGTMLQLMTGDKGSHFYCAFGAPAAHEDDAARAGLAALTLCTPPPELSYIHDTRIGIALGQTYSGAYGAAARCTYGVLGHEVNMAARLMQAAAPGQPLAGSNVQRAASNDFRWDRLAPLQVKGRADPVSVFRLVSASERRHQPLPSSAVLLPMVGRTVELARITALLDQTLAAQGRLIAITAPPGLGKSRLVVEAVRIARDRGMTVYYGGCESYATNDSYFAWQSICQAFFDVDAALSTEECIKALADTLGALNPALMPRLPLLGTVLNLPIPDNELTGSLDAKLRKASLEALLVSCLRRRAQHRPTLIVLEDAHWLDQLSNDLLEVIGLAISNVPVAVIVAYRLPEQNQQAPKIVGLPNMTVLTLEDLTSEEATELIGLKQFRLDKMGVLSDEVITQIVDRAQGNPFYIEEVLNYLHDLGLAPQTAQELEQSDLPTSLTSLILSRIDRLSERQRSTLKVASIIGRLFRATWLWGFYPDLGVQPLVRMELDVLCRVELVLQEQPDPEDSFQFRHIVTHGVAYDTMTQEMRSRLHEHLASYIEQTYPDAVDQFVHLLAYHYDLSPNQEKRCAYLRLAGEAAQAAYANSPAIDYYRRVLPLIEEDQRGPVLFRLGQVLELVGEWHGADESYRAALALAQHGDDASAGVACSLALGQLYRKQGLYTEALEWLERAREDAQVLDEGAGVVQALADMGEVYRLQGEYAAAERSYEQSRARAQAAAPTITLLAAQANALKGAGTLNAQQGNPDMARSYYTEALSVRRSMNDRPATAALLNNLAVLALRYGDYTTARSLFEEMLEIYQQIGDRWAIGQILNNLGLALRGLGELTAARDMIEESVAIRRRLGDRWGIANSLGSLTNLLLHIGEIATVESLLDETLKLSQDLGDRTAIAYCLEDYAGLAAARGQPDRALPLTGGAAALREGLGAPLMPAEQHDLDRLLAPAYTAVPDADSVVLAAKSMSLDETIALARAV